MTGNRGRIRRGDIWTIEPASFLKPRPALVISIDPINDLCPDVLVVPLTTRPGPLRVLLDAPAEITGLEQDSYAKCESLGPVYKERLKTRIGKAPRETLASIEAGVRRVLGV